MPSLSRTKKVVKVLVVSEMNIASGATDMDCFFVFLLPGFLLGLLPLEEKHLPKLWTLEIPSVAFQRLLGSRKTKMTG